MKHAELYLTEHTQTYSEAGLEQSRLWPAGTLCITIAANIADTAILAIDACFPDSVIGFVADPVKADVRFVKYLFDFTIQREVQQFTQGAAQENLSQEKLLSLKFLVPLVDEQRRIADVLSTYDALIANNRRRMALLEDAARLLYQEWFVRLRFPGWERVRVVDGGLEGWRRTTLADLSAQIDYGFTASATDEDIGPRFLRITDIVPSTIDWDAVPRCEIPDERLAKFLLAEGDIVIARTGATVGYAKRLNRRHPATVFASYLVRLRPQTAELGLLMGVFVESDAYREFVLSRVGGAAQPNASAPVLASAEILVPDQRVLEAFCRIVAGLNDEKEILAEQSAKLRAARDLLLPRLMSGEVEV